jgi:hypothetical protein
MTKQTRIDEVLILIKWLNINFYHHIKDRGIITWVSESEPMSFFEFEVTINGKDGGCRLKNGRIGFKTQYGWTDLDYIPNNWYPNGQARCWEIVE